MSIVIARQRGENKTIEMKHLDFASLKGNVIDLTLLKIKQVNILIFSILHQKEKKEKKEYPFLLQQF
jgi:hypothetical protein